MTKQGNLSELTDEQLIRKFKRFKTDRIIDAFIVGATIGIFIYGAVQNGLGFFTFFPLIIGYLIMKSSANKKLLEQEVLKEMRSRNLDPDK